MHENTLAPKTKQSLEILRKSPVIQDFYLAGGTGLALRIGHRVSEDLDWFTAKEISPLSLLDQLRHSLPGENFSEVTQSWGTLKFFHHNTMVSFFTYRYPLLEKPDEYKNYRIAGIRDIGSMKITSIADRGVRKDFIDLYFICQEIGFSDLLSAFQKKYRDANIELYHYLKSLTYFAEAEETPQPHMLKPADWEEVKECLRQEVKNHQIIPL